MLQCLCCLLMSYLLLHRYIVAGLTFITSQIRLPRKQTLRGRFAWRKFLGMCPPDQHLWGTEGRENGKREYTIYDIVTQRPQMISRESCCWDNTSQGMPLTQLHWVIVSIPIPNRTSLWIWNFPRPGPHIFAKELFFFGGGNSQSDSQLTAIRYQPFRSWGNECHSPKEGMYTVVNMEMFCPNSFLRRCLQSHYWYVVSRQLLSIRIFKDCITWNELSWSSSQCLGEPIQWLTEVEYKGISILAQCLRTLMEHISSRAHHGADSDCPALHPSSLTSLFFPILLALFSFHEYWS